MDQESLPRMSGYSYSRLCETAKAKLLICLHNPSPFLPAIPFHLLTYLFLFVYRYVSLKNLSLEALLGEMRMFSDPLILYGFSTGKLWFSFHGGTSSSLHSLSNETPRTIAQNQSSTPFGFFM